MAASTAQEASGMDPDSSARLHHGAAQSKVTVGRGVAYRRMAWEII